jgi:hypothetical protein
MSEKKYQFSGLYTLLLDEVYRLHPNKVKVSFFWLVKMGQEDTKVTPFFMFKGWGQYLYFWKNLLLFFPQRNWGNFWTKCKLFLDVNSTTFAAKYSLEKIAKFLILQNWGENKKKTCELGMKKIINVSTR